MRTDVPETLGPLTIEEFQRLPDDSPDRLELVRGRVVREPPPGALHGDVAHRLDRILGVFVAERDLGRVAVNAGFVLAEDPPSVRQPDIAFVARDSVPPAGVPTGYWPTAPTLAIEVVSLSNTITGMREKALDYLDAGTAEVWIVDPSGAMVTVHRSRRDVRLLTAYDSLDGGEILPGFTLRLAALFGS